MTGITFSARLKSKLLLVSSILFIITLLINIEISRTFPAWFDEAFFANISFNLASGNGRTLDVIPGFADGEINTYGPIYFILQAFLIDSLGLQEIVFRIPNLLAAYVSILLFVQILRQNQVRKQYYLTFIALAVVDISIHRNLLSGRMDMLAVMLVLTAVTLINSNRFKAGSERIIHWFSVGTLCALAYLTTPRSVFLLPLVVILSVSNFLNCCATRTYRPCIYRLLSVSVAFALPVLGWVMYVGGIPAYIDMYLSSDVVKSHIGTSFFRNFYDNIAIAAMLILLIKEYKVLRRSPMVVGLFANYLAFSLFVVGGDLYQGMIMPFILAAILILLDQSETKSFLKRSLLILIAGPGIALFALRSIDLYLNADCRDNENVMSALDTAIGDAQTVIAPFKYYYFLENQERNLITLEYLSVKRSEILENADALVTRQNNQYELENMGFVEVSKLNCHVTEVTLLPKSFYRGSVFNETIYRKRNS